MFTKILGVCLGTPYIINNFSPRSIKDYLPTNYKYTGQQDCRFIVYKSENVTTRKIRRVCQTILKEGIRFAAINTSQEIGWYGTIQGYLPEATEIIRDTLKNPACKLEFLDISYGNGQLKDYYSIVESLPKNSPLKCIIGYGTLCDTDRSLLEFSKKLATLKPRCPLIGYRRDAFEKFRQKYPKAASAIEKHYSEHFPGYHFTDRAAKSLYPLYERTLQPTYGSSYH